ncbi:MAG: hypothetical protein WBN26_03650, partial [Muriicola sp.]
MIHSISHPKAMKMICLGLLATLGVSCGSYQQASYYDNDGVYSGRVEQPTVYNTPRTSQPTQQKKEDGVYGEYFGQKAQEIDQIMGNEIFTDVDGYYSGVENDSLDFEAESNYFDPNNTYAGNPGWGENPTSVIINMNDNWGWGGYGWNNWGWGPGIGWGGGWGWG